MKNQFINFCILFSFLVQTIYKNFVKLLDERSNIKDQNITNDCVITLKLKKLSKLIKEFKLKDFLDGEWED